MTIVHEKEPRIDGGRFGTREDEGRLDPHLLLGLWHNCNRESRGLHQVEIKPDGAGIAVRIVSHGEDGDVDWGWQSGSLFASVEEGNVSGVASRVVYDFEFMTVEVQIRANKGVLVPTLFTTFNDSSGRSSYFTREFFHR